MEALIQQLLAEIAELRERIEALEAKQSRTKFVVPTPDEVFHEAHTMVCSKNLQLTWPRERIREVCRNFYLYYDTNGWMVGKTKMKKWQSALQRWMNNEHKASNVKQSTTISADAVSEYLAKRTSGEIR